MEMPLAPTVESNTPAVTAKKMGPCGFAFLGIKCIVTKMMRTPSDEMNRVSKIALETAQTALDDVEANRIISVGSVPQEICAKCVANPEVLRSTKPVLVFSSRPARPIR